MQIFLCVRHSLYGNLPVRHALELLGVHAQCIFPHDNAEIVNFKVTFLRLRDRGHFAPAYPRCGECTGNDVYSAIPLSCRPVVLYAIAISSMYTESQP